MQEEFLNSMEEILGDDFQKYLDSLNKIPRKAVHLNTTLLKDKNILSSFLKEQVPFDSTSYFIDEEKPGLSIFHTLGLYYVQEPSAMMPALAANIKKDAKILDLCASPGGKTLQLSNLAPDGIIYANEINGNRLKNLVSNIERLGLKNVITTQMSSKDLKNVFQNYFDVILVDAPCSLEGTFRKNPLAISLWSKEKVREMALIQKALCKDAASMLKKNGILIYSTCTFSKEEDEEVIKDVMNSCPLKIIDGNNSLLRYTKDGLTCYGEDLKKTRRCYPYLIGEGQYFAVLQKQEGDEKPIKNALEPLNKQEEEIVKKELETSLWEIPFHIYKYHSQIIAVPKNLKDVPSLKTHTCFVKIGDIRKNRIIFHHQFARCYGTYFKNKINLKQNDPLINQYLKGHEISYDVANGWGVLLVEGYPLGLYKASNKRIKNHFPKGLRI